MRGHLRAKFEVFSITITSFRQRVILPPPPLTSKRSHKKIRVKAMCTKGIEISRDRREKLIIRKKSD